MSYTKNGSGNIAIVEDNHYYPFGLKHQGYGFSSTLGNELAGKLKYNGQEYEQAVALNMYEMDFRQYDPALGRFHAVDLLAEYMPNMSPYSFGFDNPVFFSDPTGLAGDGANDGEPEIEGQLPEGGVIITYVRPYRRNNFFITFDTGFTGMNGELIIEHQRPGGGHVEPILVNRSNITIWYKPEHSEEAKPLGPNASTFDPIDGISVRSQIWKVSDGYETVIVTQNYKVVIVWDSWYTWAFGIVLSGRIDRSEVGSNWDDLFSK